MSKNEVLTRTTRTTSTVLTQCEDLMQKFKSQAAKQGNYPPPYVLRIFNAVKLQYFCNYSKTSELAFYLASGSFLIQIKRLKPLHTLNAFCKIKEQYYTLVSASHCYRNLVFVFRSSVLTPYFTRDVFFFQGITNTGLILLLQKVIRSV